MLHDAAGALAHLDEIVERVRCVVVGDAPEQPESQVLADTTQAARILDMMRRDGRGKIKHIRQVVCRGLGQVRQQQRRVGLLGVACRLFRLGKRVVPGVVL